MTETCQDLKTRQVCFIIMNGRCSGIVFRIVKQIRKMSRVRLSILALACLALIFAPLTAFGDADGRRAGPLGITARKISGGARAAPPASFKFYCGDTIVTPGDSRGEVLAKCGEPVWREMREDVITEAYQADRTPVNFITTEEWAYNFGPHQFLRFLRFQGDRLAVIETGGYGYDDQDIGRNCGDGRNISLGDRKLEVFVKCGEPMESAGGTVNGAAGRGGAPLESGEWTYNFGPDRFMYTVRFRHGKVYDIRTGGYGR
jgi:hypothetical protein